MRENTPILLPRTNSPLPDVMFTEINTALDDSYGGTDTIRTVQEETDGPMTSPGRIHRISLKSSKKNIFPSIRIEQNEESQRDIHRDMTPAPIR